LLYAWGHRPIRALLLLMGVLSLAGMPAFGTLVPIFAHHFAGADAVAGAAAAGGAGAAGGAANRDSQYLGFLMAASGLGALVGALQLARRSSVVGLGRVIATAALLFGAALIAFSFARTLPAALLIVPVAGWAMLMTFASANTLLQTVCDERMRGRVMSLFTVAFLGTAPFGNLLAGQLAAWVGAAYGGGRPATWPARRSRSGWPAASASRPGCCSSFDCPPSAKPSGRSTSRRHPARPRRTRAGPGGRSGRRVGVARSMGFQPMPTCGSPESATRGKPRATDTPEP
jgi:MFS family permease